MAAPKRSRSIPKAPKPKVGKTTKEVSAMGWIEDQTGRVLMVKQNSGAKLWTLAGGKIERSETVDAGLRREIMEETGMEVTFSNFIAIFDRPEKANVTFLYRVMVKPSGEAKRPRPREIAAVEWMSDLPPQSTPSLQFFWRMMRGKMGNP